MTEAPTRLTRRAALTGAIGTIAAALLPFKRSYWHNPPGTVLYDPASAESQRFALELAAAGPTPMVLAPDPVAQWHAGPLAAVFQDDNPVIGLSAWSHYLLIRGLAAELRRYPRFESHHHVTRDGVRHDLPNAAAAIAFAMTPDNWPETMARAMPDLGGSLSGHPSLEARIRQSPGVPRSYFIWLFA